MKIRLALAFAAMTAALPALAAEETSVRKPDGQNVTIRTDEAGTTVRNESPEATPATTPLEEQHRDAVKEVTQTGGEVTSERNPQR